MIFSVQYFSAVYLWETMACKLILLGGKGIKKDNGKKQENVNAKGPYRKGNHACEWGSNHRGF